MTRTDPLERDLTAWFADVAVPMTPDYADDILMQTAHTRQRPRWTFVERWLPTSLLDRDRRIPRPIPLRTLGLLAVLALLVAAVAALYVGSRPPRAPAPFGPAANGLVAYADAGDIFTVDPATGVRRIIVTGTETDVEPRFSLDGTRIMFLRVVGVRYVPVIVDVDGSDLLVADTPPLYIDSDSIAWSPDGRSIAIGGNMGGSPGLYILDTTSGEVRTLAVDFVGLQIFWRPPDGRQLMFLGGTEDDPVLKLVSVEDGTVDDLPVSDDDRQGLRPAGFSPDGQRFAVHPGIGTLPFRTIIVDLATGRETILPMAFGQLSNDGLRVVGFDGDEARMWVCVSRIDRGPCVRIGLDSQMPNPGHHFGLQWSPDDEWVLIRPERGGPPVVLDPDGDALDQPPWLEDGAVSWQRVAP